MADMTGYRTRYVTWREIEQQRTARAELEKMAVDSSSVKQATSTPLKSPFLAYEGCGRLPVCETHAAACDAAAQRWGVILSAASAVQSSRAS